MGIHQIMMARRLAVVLNNEPINPILQRVLDYAVSNSITTPQASKLLHLNRYCNALENAGILAHTGAGGVPTSASDFTTSDVFVNFAYNDVGLDEFSLIDWIRLTEMTTHGGMSYTSEGWEGNAVDGYIDTLFNPNTGGINYLLDDSSRGTVVYVINTAGATTAAIDSAQATNQNSYRAGNYSFQRINQTTNILNASADLSGTGYKGINRDDNTNVRLQNEATELARTATSTVVAAVNQYLFRVNTGYADLGLSNYLMGKSLTYAQTQDLRTAKNTYLSSIGLTPIA